SRRRPYVALNMVATLDGRAAVDGTAVGLGSPTDYRLLRRLRGEADAVLHGAGTVRAHRLTPRVDDEALAARVARGQSKQPAGGGGGGGETDAAGGRRRQRQRPLERGAPVLPPCHGRRAPPGVYGRAGGAQSGSPTGCRGDRPARSAARPRAPAGGPWSARPA